MAPHRRTGLLAVAGCIALGALLAAIVHFAVPSSAHESKLAASEPVRVPLADAVAALAPEATSTPAEDETKEDDDANAEDDRTEEPEPGNELAAAPPPRYRATSVFGARQRGSLACGIPGQDSFLVEWNAASDSAVAHFANARIAGSMQQRANASNTIESSLQFSFEDGGHSLSMSISDSGAMRAAVDGRESSGSCSPA